MKKRLISLMLAGAMLTGVGAVAGCGEDQPEIEDGVTSSHIYEELYGKNLIVAVYEKLVVLHKADVYNRYSGSYSGQIGSKVFWIGDRLDFKCGKEDDHTTMYHDYGTTMPDETAYDVLCEECFNTSK